MKVYLINFAVREDIHWNTDQGEDLIHLYVNMISSTDQNPQREVQTIGSNIDWQIGASVTFSCIAAPHLFSSGVKWAIEMTDGSLKYQKDSKYIEFSSICLKSNSNNLLFIQIILKILNLSILDRLKFSLHSH